MGAQKQIRIVLVVCVIACLVLLLWGVTRLYPLYSDSGQRPQDGDRSLTFLARVAQFRAEIRAQGGAKAYQEMREIYASSTEPDQHLMGHAFGRALFEEEGTNGLLVCGLEFGGGCLHEFSATAIETEGIGVVAEFNRRCTEGLTTMRSTACQHGMGHGLIGYLGYTATDLNEALSVCTEVDATETRKGCYGGAYMEFNGRYMTGTILRAYTPDAPFGVCGELDGAFRPSCFFWTTEWILDAGYDYEHHLREAFKGVGAVCAAVPTAYADDCFEGLGYFAAPDVVRAEDLCSTASDRATFRAYCRAGAAQMMSTAK